MNNKTEKQLDYEYVRLLEALQKGNYWWIIPFFVIAINLVLSFFIKSREFALIDNFFSITGFSFVLTHLIIVIIGTMADNTSRQIYAEATSEHPKRENIINLAFRRRTLYTVLSVVIMAIICLIFVCFSLPEGIIQDIFVSLYQNDVKMMFGIYLFFALSETLKTRKIVELARIIGE